MTADLSSTAAAHTGKYGFEITVTELFQNNWHALLSLPAFLVTDHERMYTLTFWAKGNGNPHPRPQVTFQDEDAQYAYIDSAYVQLTSFWHQYSVALAIPYRLRGHNVIANVMVGAYLGSYYFDDFQAWPEGEMHVTLQSTQAAHSGRYGVLINVAKRFEQDWHAQVSLKGFTPPDTDHGYIFSFWGRAAADVPGGRAMPKVVFQDADDSYTPLKQVSVPLTSSWQMYEVDISVPKYREGHTIIISFWVGEFAGTYALDDFQRAANNGSWVVSVPDARAAHSGGAGLYVEVSKAWKVASLARLLLPRYVPRAGQEMLLHLAFWARAEKMKSTDPTPSVTVAFLDLHKNYEEIGAEMITIPHTDWQMHYVVIDLKAEHVGHSIRPYLYIGKDAGIYYFDEFEYKEIEIEDGMAWLQRAPERIRRRRMGKFQLSFHDNDDWPIDYGVADVALQRHHFELGVDVMTRPMSAMAAADYLWYLRTAARHFWAGAIEQGLLWADYEPTPGDISSSQKAIDDVITWSGSQSWSAISATLLDGGHEKKEHWSNKLACQDLKARLHERLARDLAHFRGKIRLYEVWKGSLHSRDWIDRCGESLYFDAYRWAQQADPAALLCSSEAAVLTTLTLTNAEAYHNLVYRLVDQGVPIKAVCVQAIFEGEVDASTVKHRLDVLHELRLPVYITEFTISGLDPAKHSYELEKFLRIAFSHESVAGILLGDLWDRPASATGKAITSGLYAANKEAKPAAARLDHLWKSEWTSRVQKGLSSEGSLDFDGYYGKYEYHLKSDDGKTSVKGAWKEDANDEPSQCG
ncbi:glycoside hydrolase family 10 [Chrysochromulina tobinii]|uniref:Glycoside hydrolase family 10 n=1 Tax=Chrysochromulina tobinii TaxID=1460289 RepID=A0A0M0JCB0_9EUKA|nr:glycoside hydrolase family 10 [Chrysochromulina tobinii]|eukprot:KOO23982.1 glycoside hydrolase family 10 [Chrysochromulina sp. CCMP291]